MNVKIENFVGIFEDAYSLDFCTDCINAFENANSLGLLVSRQQHDGVPKTQKDTLSGFITADDSSFPLDSTKHLMKRFNDTFWGSIHPMYADTYAVLKESSPYNFHQIKMQKTLVGGGYHVWHYESASRNASNRLALCILYLNDVAEGGETEFLYYPKRIKPKAGTLIILPASYTHTHRGNPPMSNDKYILNGWLEF
jgi:hypothetical protein